jgi:hypothetical protein
MDGKDSSGEVFCAMGMIECARCGCMQDARSMAACGICGAHLCDSCARESHGLCDDCAAGDRE